MFITTKVVISFEVPNEYALYEKFRLDNDMSKWTEIIDTRHVSLIKVDTVKVETNEKQYKPN